MGPVERRRPAWGRIIARLVRWVAIGIPVAFSVDEAVSADVRYLARAGAQEAGVLWRRSAIADLVKDRGTRPALKQRLQLVLDARRLGADSLGLAVGETYTTYADVGRDTLLLVLSASPKNKLHEYTWKYPIVGVVPYKGFFSVHGAQEAAADLDAQGLDTYLRPSGAFSTLGYFNDPLVSTAVSRDPMALVATVIHQLAHHTLYVPSQTPLNESFASFVGYRGAQAFFHARHDSLDAARAAARWRDERTLDVFYAELARRLDSAYSDTGSPATLVRTRGILFNWAHQQLAGPGGQGLATYDCRWFPRPPVINAVTIPQRLSPLTLNLFHAIYPQTRP